ncbi:tryptophanyl-tRNA synthetase [Coniochaeta ligniaria NRRL 30616]|uniref:Tryptophan--tRNA ligase, mitochondrial n=1 Tax=Coniochaeta ligniaria NRRL 30616 TaxID=1408157 RepID=A0A1J7J3L0_9PEZI|nr:tryptophanyl-tRNA synthetase [Coniochaeta ligniaria NRRL 30616]
MGPRIARLGPTLGQLQRAQRRAASQAASDSDAATVIFSGIQPTGIPHLGNYLGALQNWRRLQDEAQPGAKLLYSIVDLHAITLPQQAPMLRQWKREMLAALLAVGLDPARSSIFYQSSVPAHTELMWILSCTASMGYLSRMTQWKSKLHLSDDASALDEKAKASLKLGLFSYPVLQAADILVHRATHVPVGEDQRQHLEFARECATNFNHTFGAGSKLLVPPETILSPAKRIMSLQTPTSKMSKSDTDPRSRILLTDSAEEIHKKIMAAKTDSTNAVSYDRAARPGVANLLELWASFDARGRGPEMLAEELGGQKASLKDLKTSVADVLVEEIPAIGVRYREFLEKDGGRYLDEVEEEGARVARKSADETMEIVKRAVGLSR